MDGRTHTQYDVAQYRYDVEVFGRLTTKAWGWDHREHSGEKSTELYSCYLAISLRISQAQLREFLINEVNAFLQRRGILCSIEFNGLPSSDDLIRIREEMVRGTITFGRALESSAI